MKFDWRIVHFPWNVILGITTFATQPILLGVSIFLYRKDDSNNSGLYIFGMLVSSLGVLFLVILLTLAAGSVGKLD